MALQLTPDEFETIKGGFVAIDKDGDGQLTKEELTAYFGSDKQDKVDFTMKLMDLDCNGSVEFHEFLEMVAFLDFHKGVTEWKIKQFFRALDTDGNGVLSADEIRNFYKMISGLNTQVPSNDEIETLIQSLDANGDGRIDCEEFIKGYFEF